MFLKLLLDQNEIIPKLARKLIDLDEKVRAASEAALLNTLLKHKSSVDVIFTYIEYIRYSIIILIKVLIILFNKLLINIYYEYLYIFIIYKNIESSKS